LGNVTPFGQIVQGVTFVLGDKLGFAIVPIVGLGVSLGSSSSSSSSSMH
jgi:hypothetical protein